MPDLRTIAQTISSLAAPGMRPKDLVAAVREKHPDLTKKEVARAALYAMIEAADHNPDKAAELQAAAYEIRAEDDETADAHGSSKRKRQLKRSASAGDSN